MANDFAEETEDLPLSKTVTYILEECRMVLPGIQALFGFQLIAVFNQRFDLLGPLEQRLHLAALFLVAVATALVLGPAAYQRHAERERVSRRFVVLATRLLLLSMFPLTAGASLDFYLIAQLVLRNRLVGALLAAILFVFFFTIWFLLPRVRFLQRMMYR